VSIDGQDVLQQLQIRRVGEAEAVELGLFEPVNGIVLFGLPVRNGASPPARYPNSEVQPGLGIDSSQNRITFEAFKLDPQFLGQFSSESVLGALAGLDMTTRKVPDVGKPLAARRSVT
jgi:hypothetical protein